MKQIFIGDVVYFRNDDRGLVPAIVMHIEDETTVDLNVFIPNGVVFVASVKRGNELNEWHAREESLG